MRQGGRQNFTLVELLVVIAVIAILAGFLMPVLNQSREAALKTSCMNNFRQIALGCTLYCDEFDGILPGNYYDGATKDSSGNTIDNWSLMLSYKGRYIGTGVIVKNGNIPLDVMWCPNAEVACYEYGGQYVRFTPDSPEFGRKNFGSATEKCYCTTIKAGTAMTYAPEANIYPQFTKNIDRAVFMEYRDHHGDGLPAVFGDGHAQYILIDEQKWKISSSMFKYIMDYE